MRCPRKLVVVVGAVLLSAPLLARDPVRTRHAMVATQEPLATDAGVAVLASGGNAVDAAVAVAFTLAVTLPAAGNIGGGGFALIRMADGTATFLDFRERAPAAAHAEMYLDGKGELTPGSLVGWRAAGIPGTVMGLAQAHAKFGNKKWSDLLEPAIRLARGGFEVSWAQARSFSSSQRLPRFAESRRIFLNEGRRFEAGDVLVQPELAATLERIARNGAREFYRGETARRLVAAMQDNDGLFTAADLTGYEVIEREPLRGRYRGYEILTAPPPSSGGIGILQMFGMLEGTGYEKPGAGSAAVVHYVAEVMRRFFADRSRFIADPGYYDVPVRRLLSPAYVHARRATIDPERATPSGRVQPGPLPGKESSDTTHLSIMDEAGNTVALTYTLNGSYGCGVTVPGLGFLLNNEMDDFAAKPGSPNLFGLIQGKANRIEPGKRPLSSMTPTIVMREGAPYIALGGRGGPRIINGVFEALLNVLDFGLNIQDALDRPRFHHQWRPDKLYLESGFSPDTVALLTSRGHKIATTGSVATVEAILFDGEWFQGGTDGRGHGKTAGY